MTTPPGARYGCLHHPQFHADNIEVLEQHTREQHQPAADELRAAAALLHATASRLEQSADIAARAILAAAPPPDGAETAAVRPQDATGGVGESPAASGGASGPHRGVQPSVTHVHHDHNGDEWIHAGAAEDCDLPDCAEPTGADLPEHATDPQPLNDLLTEAVTPAPGDGLREEIAAAIHEWVNPEQADIPNASGAVLAVVQPRLDDAHRRIATLEHVARSNKRHVQALVPDLEHAEAAIQRVRDLHRKASHGATCVYCAPMQRIGYDADWPCDTSRALDGTDTPTET